jgi:hypothetical protein
MERKRDVVAALLNGLGEQQLIAMLSAKLKHEKKVFNHQQDHLIQRQ